MKFIDEKNFMVADNEVFIQRHFEVLRDLLQLTARPGKALLEQAINMAYDDLDQNVVSSFVDRLLSCLTWSRGKARVMASGVKYEPWTQKLCLVIVEVNKKHLQGQLDQMGASLTSPKRSSSKKNAADSPLVNNCKKRALSALSSASSKSALSSSNRSKVDPRKLSFDDEIAQLEQLYGSSIFLFTFCFVGFHENDLSINVVKEEQGQKAH